MKKSKQMKDRVRGKLEEIFNEEDFVSAMLAALKNDYDCENLLRLIDKFHVRTPDNVLIMTVIISNMGIRAKYKGDYLKDIDDTIEHALLEEGEDIYL